VDPFRRALITGGIGSGKSTAAGVLAGLGAAVFSADTAAREALEPGGAAYAPATTRWPEVVGADGRIDRSALGRIVFDDPVALAELEAMTHPAVRESLRAAVSGVRAPLLLVEVPLPVDVLGPGWPRVVVDAPDEVRMARLLARGMSRPEITQRMAAQPDRGEWLAVADMVLDNGGDLDRLEAECRRVWRALVGSDPAPASR
jgi:dephospho-CoA kinase